MKWENSKVVARKQQDHSILTPQKFHISITLLPKKGYDFKMQNS